MKYIRKILIIIILLLKTRDYYLKSKKKSYIFQFPELSFSTQLLLR